MAGPAKLSDAIVHDVVGPRPNGFGAPVRWTPDVAELTDEVRRWLLRSLEPDVLREWVERPARPAFDAFLVELVARAVLLASAYAASGLPSRQRHIEQVDHWTRVARQGRTSAASKARRARDRQVKRWTAEIAALKRREELGIRGIHARLNRNGAKGPSRDVVAEVVRKLAEAGPEPGR